ncbi:trafficking protein particle complex subunit 10 [Gloeopeniophorella convolvens]|nr:trafficking protein particle complex subunit 10 [Gloeopeniophorella convolvens]
MSTQRVIVTYSAPQSFLSSDQWKQIHSALLSQLPLRNIHWKPQTRPSIRTIQELEVQLIALDGVRDEHASQVPSTLLERPLLNMYIVTCEDGDIYKATVRKQIKDWLASFGYRKNQEWIIVHVVRSDNRNVSTNFFQMKSNVLDRIRADFNTDKRDRCVQLAWPTAKDNPVAWAELLSKAKDSLLTAFDAAISQRDDEVRRSESQKSMPGWNFCTFFILKESLASSFEGMYLFEDALHQYDELEQSFAHVLTEKNLSWFGTLIIPGARDDSLPLLSVSKKPYRDLIVANTVSVFDLRIYMLAQQCTLLGKMGKVADVCRKVAVFLTSFGRRLREIDVILPQYFIESWTYSSALSVIEQTDAWAQGIKLEGPALIQFSACKAELLELARHQLDVFGIRLDLLPSKPPFSISLTNAPVALAEDKRKSRTISNSELLRCLGDQSAFYDLYIGLTNRAIDAYVKAGRRKFALRLHGSLAALDVHRDRLSTALQTYTSLPAHYAPHKWSSLESYMLAQAIDVYALSGADRDKQWINTALSYLRSYVDSSSERTLAHEDDKSVYITKLVESLGTAVDKLGEPFTHTEHPALSIRLLSTAAESAEDEDGSFLDVSVVNTLPCSFPADEICVALTGRESERLEFRSPVKSLEPGTSNFRLFCPSSSWGTYIFDQSELKISNLHLQWSHRTAGKSKPSRTKHTAPTLIRLEKDVHAFDVRLKRPRSIELGRDVTSNLLLTVSSGRNHISKATLKLSGPTGVNFLFKKSVLDGNESSASLICADDCIAVLDLPENSELSILVPHSDASAYNIMQINITVTYSTTKEPAVNRSLLQSSRVPTSLPVAVNVQDFFRGERLFQRFTISTTALQYIRVSSATYETVEDQNDLSISGTLTQKSEITTITPSRPAHFLFQLASPHGRVLDTLRLCIKYRMLRDEVEDVLEHTVDEALKELPQHHTDRSRLISHMIQALESNSDWVDLYSITGELKVPPFNGDGAPPEIVSRIREVLAKSRPPGVNSGSWREIRIPVDVPLMNILAAARLRILTSPFSEEVVPTDQLPPLYAGQPISAVLSIQTSLHWGTRSGAGRRPYRMRFDIEEMVRDWLVSGPKRGDFEAEDGSTYTASVTLIALHYGELSLPKVIVSPMPLAGEMTMGSLSLPNIETHQVHGAEKVLILPRGGRSTFIVGMGEGL